MEQWFGAHSSLSQVAVLRSGSFRSILMGPLQRTELAANISVALFCFCPQNHHKLSQTSQYRHYWDVICLHVMYKIHTKTILKHLIVHIYGIRDYYRFFTDIYFHWRIRTLPCPKIQKQHFCTSATRLTKTVVCKQYGISTTDSDRAYRQRCRAVVPWAAPVIDVQSIAKYRRADATKIVPAPQLQHHGQRQSSWTLQQRTSTMDSSKDPRVRPLISTVELQHHGQRQHLNFSTTDSNSTFRQC